MLHRFLPLAALVANEEQQRRWIAFAVVSALALMIAHLVDGCAYRTLGVENVYDDDFGRLLRIAGYVPTWLLASAALVLTDWPRRAIEGTTAAWRRGLLLLSGVVVAGIVGELLKLVFRRERPRAHEGEYVFRAFTERPFDSSGLALPSTHSVVAFGAAAMLSHLFPRAQPIWWGMAVGCAWTRVADGAHFVSDVVLAAVTAWAVVEVIWQRWGRND
jgi:membrane-associated phospholipid phosphatase